METLDELRTIAAELTDLHHIIGLMQWDQEVSLPLRAAGDRAEQFATLSGIIHRKETAARMGELLKAAEDRRDRLSEKDRALVRVMRRAYDQATKQPEEFVTEFSRLVSSAYAAWVEARQKSDFHLFAPLLARIVEMSRQKAEYLGYEEHPYDALLDLHEEGLRTSEVERLFHTLKEPLIRLVQRAAATPPTELVIEPPFELAAQIRFAEQVLAKMGYDFDRGRQDQAAHPFSTTLGRHDQRVTNRYAPRSLEFIFVALHEGGHALYEQGVDETLGRSPLGGGVSLGIHESQSRLWENIIGRSRPFWAGFLPALQQAFPAQLGKIPLDAFLAAVNSVHPGPIRVEAGEVSYNLHVLIRFEIEKALMEGALKVSELPEIWNQKYREYLAVAIADDSQGVLQDVHWSHGSLGYFPTYTLGNVAAAQIWNRYAAAHPDYEESIRRGDFRRIREWLTENIYSHGSIYPPSVLIRRVTGEELDSKYFLRYLQDKFSWLTS